MDNLPLLHYGVIYADPAWSYENWSEAGALKNASSHYDCMDLAAIKALPVGHLANKDCVLFLWVTDPLLQEGLEVMRAWGFKYQTVAFTWVKLNKRFAKLFPIDQSANSLTIIQKLFFMGLGYWTRGNPEMCLLGTMGSPERIGKGVRQLIVSPIREHSRKPDIVRERIQELVPGPYLELFAREEHENWDSWGNEVGKFDAPETPK